MGLDITAYQRLEFLKSEFTDEDIDNYERVVVIYDNVEFPQGRELRQGVYAITGETLEFRAGSYSGYNQFRSELAHLVGTTDEAIWKNPTVKGPFVEMINFSDCEGTLGPRVSSKLASDFAEHQSKADAKGDEYFSQLYGRWRQAFEMAAQGGAVRFH